MIDTSEFKQQVDTLLKKAKLSTSVISIDQCTGGGNNRTYQLKTSDGEFALKKYFQRPEDIRDRLASEFSFLSYAKKAAPNFVPTPYAKDENLSMALYEFVEGSPIKPGDVTETDVAQAIEFFCALNNSKVKPHADYLPFASEACFSLQDHLDLVAGRIQSLHEAEDKDVLSVLAKLQYIWHEILKKIISTVNYHELDMTRRLDDDQRCVSPSDFGFHNALRMSDGSIKFLDFEYAGWDDPAKMTGDFFSQLAVPVPAEYFNDFTTAVMQVFSRPQYLVDRARLLRPVFQIKWCCIALNIFIPVNLERRKFANPNLDVSDLKKTQLAKAELILKNLEGLHYG